MNLDFDPSFSLLDSHAIQPSCRHIAPTTQTSRCNPGKNRCSGEGTEPDHRWATLPCEGRGSHTEKEEAEDERGGESQKLSEDEGPVGEEEGKKANNHGRSGQNKRAISGISIEGPDRPSPEGGRKARNDSQGLGGEVWEKLRQHQRLVPHYWKSN